MKSLKIKRSEDGLQVKLADVESNLAEINSVLSGLGLPTIKTKVGDLMEVKKSVSSNGKVSDLSLYFNLEKQNRTT